MSTGDHLRVSWVAAVCRVTACLLLAAPAHAQYGVDSWTTDAGLPQNVIRAVHQTRDGYLWLATLDGLVRFDGVRFTVFDRSSSPGIGSNRFLCLYESVNGDLWAGTEAGGLTRYQRGAFTTYTTQHGLPNPQVNGITGDDQGNLWVLSQGRIVQWDRDRFRPATLKGPPAGFVASVWDTTVFWAADETTLYRFSRGQVSTRGLPGQLRNLAPTNFEEDRSGTLWLSVPGGRVARVGADNRVTFYQVFDTRGGGYLEIPLPPGLQVSHRDRHGTVWPMDLNAILLRHFRLPTQGAERVPVASLYEDREGNLWLGTEGRGLYRVRRQVVTTYSSAHGLAARNVYPVFEDRDGAVWIGAWPVGVSRMLDRRFTNYTAKDGLATGQVTAFAEDRDGRVWLAGHHERNSGLRVFEHGRFSALPDGIVSTDARVAAIVHDAAGATWLGTTHGLVRYQDGIATAFTEAEGLAGNDVRVIVAGEGDSLWIGSTGGLTHLAQGTFTRWTERDGLPSNSVRALYRDRDGVLWIGTYDGGLGRLKEGRLARVTTRDGLFNNGVFQILEDAQGFLWMCSNRGIHRVSKHELNEFAEGRMRMVNALAFGTSDGMLSAECNGGYWPAGVRARDGRLWFPTQDGVAVIDPQTVALNPRAPPTLIENVLIDRQPVPLDQPVRVAPGSGQFEIQYTSLSLVNSERIRFRYRLAGLDRDWVDAGTRRVAYYSGVPPGDYTFSVISADGAGAWNAEGANLPIAVVPPFWRTDWFASVAILGAVGAGVLWYRRRVAAFERASLAQAAFSRQLIESQESERKRIAAELHDSLGQNLLIIKNRASLGSLVTQDVGSARAEFDAITATAARSIDEVRQIAYDLRPYHLDRLGLTSSIEEMIERVASSSAISFSTTIAPLDGVVPKNMEINLYRIVQEGVNNIVRHSHAHNAWIEISRRGRDVGISIRDDGQGFRPVTDSAGLRPSFGLTGIAERVQMLGASHSVASAPGQGTTITITLSLRDETSSKELR